MIPVHELETPNNSLKPFDIIELLPKTGPSNNVPHRHDYYEMFLFKNGGGAHLIDFNEIPVTPTSIHLVAPGQVHLLKRSDDSVGFAVLFEESFLGNHPDNVAFVSRFAYMEMETYSPVFEFSEKEYTDIRHIFEMIMMETERPQELNYDIIRDLLNVVIMHCRRKESNGSRLMAHEGQRLYAEFRKQVDLKFRTLKKVKEYADLLNTTERHLNEAGKKRSGKSASTIIFERIITEAKRLIVNTDMSVKEICFELNYDDPAHFSKFFKTQSGYSPSQFRELYTK